jgi:hypothetical protein
MTSTQSHGSVMPGENVPTMAAVSDRRPFRTVGAELWSIFSGAAPGLRTGFGEYRS